MNWKGAIMKKLISILLAVMLCAGVFAGCSVDIGNDGEGTGDFSGEIDFKRIRLKFGLPTMTAN